MISSFLGFLINDYKVQEELREAAAEYPFAVTTLADLRYCHIISWEYWESDPVRLDAADCYPIPWGPIKGLPMDNIVRYLMPHTYAERIQHFCSRERLGKMWPRLIHGIVTSYVRERCNPDTWPDGPQFQVIVQPEFLNPQCGALVGYQRIPRLEAKKVDGRRIVVMSPDEPMRKVQRRFPREARSFLSDNADRMKTMMQHELGYERRRIPTADMISTQVGWLYRRHILGESYSSIAKSSMVAESTVESVVKTLRRALDLQPKYAVRCLDHRRRPWPLYSQ
jgi:hypothetical protein